MTKVLVSGASIAGPTVAYWLSRNGHDVTVVERAPAPRPGGQAVDVRGVGLTVLSRMGLLEATRAQRTALNGVSVVDINGNELWRSMEETLSGGRFDTDDIEILRDDLARILLDRIQPRVRMLYGETIVAMAEHDAGVDVRFEHRPMETFDLVVGADGLYSNVRRLMFDESGSVHSLGVGLAVFTAPNFMGLKNWQIAHREGQGGFLIYTARQNTEVRVALGFEFNEREGARLSLDSQKKLVAARCAHFTWEVPRLIEAMWTASDFYFGAVAQVKQKSWARGRIALVGDAAYCPSPFSGQGTSLALVGAYVLADELGRNLEDCDEAFSRYRERMREFVALNQALATSDDAPSDKDQALVHAKCAINL